VKNPLESYRRTDLMTANRETILLMMYGGAMRFLKQAIEAGEANDFILMNKMVAKTQEIVNELRSTLNFEVGGDIAKNLEMLYGFVSDRLLQGCLEKQVKPLGEALGIIQTLNEAWEQAIASLKKERAQAETSK